MAKLYDILLNDGNLIPVMSDTSPTVGLDLAQWLASGESIADPEVLLYDLSDRSDQSATYLVGSPSVSGTVILQKLADLPVGARYRIEFRFRRSPGADTDGGYAFIGVPA